MDLNDLTPDIKPDKTGHGFFALNILKTKAKSVFASNKALFCLTKSDTFFKELLNIFNGLYSLNINADKFLEIVKSLETSDTDKERLLLTAVLLGHYIKIMEQNSYTIPKYKSLTPQSCCHSELDSESPALAGQGLQNVFSELQNHKCLEFADVQSECAFVVNEIKKSVETGDSSYSDFAVYADKSEMRQKLLDMLKVENVPVVSSIYNEDYENLKYKISLFHKISEVLKTLGFEEFSHECLKNLTVLSKAQKEICFEELDEYIKTLIIETVTDNFSADKVLAAKETSKKTILESVYSYWQKFSEKDRELLAKEFGLLKSFYGYFKEQNYAKAVIGVVKSSLAKFENTELKDIIAGKIKSLNELQELYDKVLNAVPDFESFKEIMEWLPKDKSKDKNAVVLVSISSDVSTKRGFRFVYVAGLTENNFPGANTAYPFVSLQTNELLNCALKKVNENFECFLKTDEIFQAQRYSSMRDVFGCAKEKIIFSTHSYEAKRQVQPSPLFKAVVDFNPERYEKITESNKESLESSFSAKAEFDSVEKSVIVSENDILKLNPSAISTFQNCPRKYYYKNLLNLKEPYSFSASYGSVVHAVFEVLNRRFLDRYNKEIALELARVLFASKNSEQDAQNALKAGFKQTDIELIDAASELSLAEMKENFFDAIEDYSMSGGFDEAPVSVVCEKSFSFKLKELPNVVFDGRIDAIAAYKDGSYKVVDYKTGRDKTNTLEYAVSEYGVNFLSKTGKAPSNPETLQNAYDYQIPIYYFACSSSSDLSEFKDKIEQLGLLYIRPKSKDNGCNEDFVKAEKIEFYKDKIIQNLKETVVDKILNETEFKKNKSFNCDNCAYKFLCDTEGEDE